MRPAFTSPQSLVVADEPWKAQSTVSEPEGGGGGGETTSTCVGGGAAEGGMGSMTTSQAAFKAKAIGSMRFMP
jgi:hypothetical protein